MELEKIGRLVFIVGIILAIATGATAVLIGMNTSTAGIITMVLVILGFIVGFLNVKDKEAATFLIAVITLGVIGTVQVSTLDQLIPSLGTTLQLIVIYVAIFIVPAGLVVALKAVYNIAYASGKLRLTK